MQDVRAVTDFFVTKLRDAKRSLDVVQIFLYYANGWYFVLSGAPLFKEKFRRLLDRDIPSILCEVEHPYESVTDYLTLAVLEKVWDVYRVFSNDQLFRLIRREPTMKVSLLVIGDDEIYNSFKVKRENGKKH